MKAIAMIAALLLWGCGVKWYSASTTASYETADGKKVYYESNKDNEGVVVVIKGIGEAQTIEIRVEKSGTSDAALAAAIDMSRKMTDWVKEMTPLILKGAAMAGS